MFVCLIIAGLVFHLNVTGPIAFPMIEAVSKRLIGSAAGVFWFYAVICLIAFFWGRKYLPETKGRTLEEIAQSWTRRSQPAVRASS